MLLPPAEARSRRQEALAWLASRDERWAARARRRWRRLHYGARFASALEALDRRLAKRPVPEVPALPAEGLDLPPGAGYPLWVEVSPSPLGFPAAAERIARPGAGWTLPEEIAGRIAG